MTKSKKAAQSRYSDIAPEEAQLLQELFSRRINQLQKAVDECAGSLYPGIYAGQIDRIKSLYEKLTGFPIDKEA